MEQRVDNNRASLSKKDMLRFSSIVSKQIDKPKQKSWFQNLLISQQKDEGLKENIQDLDIVQKWLCYTRVIYAMSVIIPLACFIWMRVSQPIIESQELAVKNWLYINFIITFFSEPMNVALEILRHLENFDIYWHVICLKQEKYQQLREIY